jgi:hypothetical protein
MAIDFNSKLWWLDYRAAQRWLRLLVIGVYSKQDLRPLVKGFGAKVHVLYVGLDRGKHSAHFSCRKWALKSL